MFDFSSDRELFHQLYDLEVKVSCLNIPRFCEVLSWMYRVR